MEVAALIGPPLRTFLFLVGVFFLKFEGGGDQLVPVRMQLVAYYEHSLLQIYTTEIVKK